MQKLWDLSSIQTQFHEMRLQLQSEFLFIPNITATHNVFSRHLHRLLHALTSLPPSQSQPSLLIIAHKSDLLKTGSSSSHTNSATLAVNRVKTILERELEKRRVSQTGGINIEGLGEEGERSDMGGLECGEKEGSTFKFDDWEGGDVVFLGTSAVPNASQSDEKTTGGNGLGPLQEWIENNF
jgi:signal recognition particle receptor subunit beta